MKAIWSFQHLKTFTQQHTITFQKTGVLDYTTVTTQCGAPVHMTSHLPQKTHEVIVVAIMNIAICVSEVLLPPSTCLVMKTALPQKCQQVSSMLHGIDHIPEHSISPILFTLTIPNLTFLLCCFQQPYNKKKTQFTES
jgi:hypothetical protein